MRNYDDEAIINVGVGEDLSIRELAELVARVTRFGGALDFDVSKPDGTPRKLLDVSLLRSLGWHAQVPLEEGVRRTYEWFKANCNSLRG
jgi:GDP-L-fucose synthase